METIRRAMMSRAAPIVETARATCTVLAVAGCLAAPSRAGELEKGLPPSAVAPNIAQVPIPLKQRMEMLQVPGVSIAYIHDGRIAWAGGYGVARIGGPAVTTDTRFQAASISKAVTAF